MKKLSLSSLLAVGVAAASVLASIAPAHAMSWNVTWGTPGQNSVTLDSTDTSPDANGFYNIIGVSNVTWNGSAVTGTTLLPDSFNIPGSGLVMANDHTFNPIASNHFSLSPMNYATIAFANSDTDPIYYQLGIAFGNFTTSGTSSGYNSGSNNYASGMTFNVSAAVPFSIPGGATIPAIGSLLVLGALRKAKKMMSSKNDIKNFVSELSV